MLSERTMDVVSEPGVATATDGTGESQTSEQRIEQSESEAYTPAELREIYEEALEKAMAKQWNAISQRLTPLEQLRAQVERLQPQLEEVLGKVEEAKALSKMVAKGETLDDSQWAALDEAARLKEQQRTDALQKAEQAKRDAELEEARKNQLTPEKMLALRWAQLDEDMEEFGTEQGLKWDDVKGLRPDRFDPSQGDPYGDRQSRKKWRAAILAKAGEREKEGNAQMSVPTVRGGGAPRETYADRLGDYNRPPPTPEEIDRETAKYLQR